nr:hypothetical protein [Tanacetum cinerariifolium]
VTLSNEERLNLLDERGEDGGEHESTKDDVLHAGLCAVGPVERETDEETSDGAESELGEDVSGHSPVLLEHTVCALPDLGP